MRCDECLSLLDQYVEDEVHDQTAKSLAAHLTTCRECDSAYETLRREQEIYASYLLDVEPPPNLWANLKLKLEEKATGASQSQPLFQRWLAVTFGGLHFTPQLAIALVIMMIGLTIGILVWRTTADAPNRQAQNPGAGVQPSSEVIRANTQRESDNTDRRAATEDNDGKILPLSAKSGDRRRHIRVSAANRAGRRMAERTPAAPTIDQVARRAEQQYLSAIEILSRDFERRRAVISPALLSPLQRALAEVDRNIAATRRAAREQPGDPVAVQYLAMAYEKKVELLREVIGQ